MSLCLTPGSICRGKDAGIQEKRLVPPDHGRRRGWRCLHGDGKRSLPRCRLTRTARSAERFSRCPPLNFTGSLVAQGLNPAGSGEIGIAVRRSASWIRASRTSVPEEPEAAPSSPAALSERAGSQPAQPEFAFLTAITIHNNAAASAENVQVIHHAADRSAHSSPRCRSAPARLPGGQVCRSRLGLLRRAIPRREQLSPRREGNLLHGGVTFCFTLNADILIPPGSPGSAIVGTVSVDPNTTEGGFPPQPPDSDEDVNTSRWTVPRDPFVPGTPTATGTSAGPIPLGPLQRTPTGPLPRSFSGPTADWDSPQA